jgi:hypothetical protein
MPLERRIVEAAFLKKGFVRSSGDHNFFTYHTINGKKTSVWTKTSRGSGHKTLVFCLANIDEYLLAM